MGELGSTHFDRTTYRIVRELCRDGRMSDATLGERVHLSNTTVARRRKLLEECGLLRGYSATFDIGRMGFTITAMVSIMLSSQTEAALAEFERAVIKCPSTSYCGFVTGDAHFIMIVHVRSFDDYDRVYRSELSTLPHVARIRSRFVMRPVADRAFPQAVFL